MALGNVLGLMVFHAHDTDLNVLGLICTMDCLQMGVYPQWVCRQRIVILSNGERLR